MFSKIKKFIFGDEVELKNRRAKFRFKTEYLNQLSLVLESKSYKIKELSLDGFSFETGDPKAFSISSEKKGQLSFKDSKVQIEFIIKSYHSGSYGCQISHNKANYQKFITTELSDHLISYFP